VYICLAYQLKIEGKAEEEEEEEECSILPITLDSTNVTHLLNKNCCDKRQK
jgi:hypothetical protein